MDTMSKKSAEPDDPMGLVGVTMPPVDEQVFADMAESLADEYLRMGYSKDQVLEMFRNPFYRMTHAIWQTWGEQKTKTLVGRLAQRYEMLRVNKERHDAPGT